MKHPTKKIIKIELKIVLLLKMAIINTMKVLQSNLQHWQTNKISSYNIITTEGPDILLLNELGVTNNGLIKINGYKREQKNISNQARDEAALAIKRIINHRIKIQTGIGPIIIPTMYIPPRKPIISRADFDTQKTHNSPVYAPGDYNGNHRL